MPARLRPATWMLLLCVGVSAVGCQTASYYTQAIGGQWELSSRQRPIEEVLAETERSDPLHGRLELVRELVAFAEEDLGLPVGDAYGDYADLGRRYVVWNVFAAPEFSLEPRTWWYPVVGSLAYRGYFDHQPAIDLGQELAKRGEDVFVGGVAAYSTLGWFDDPVLNTFVNDPDTDLAELLFHELAHRRLFIAGDTDFNEAFATATGREGVRRWLISRNENGIVRDYLQRRRRDDQVIALILKKRDELEDLYAAAESPSFAGGEEWLRQAKAEVITSLRNDYATLKRQWAGYRTFDKFMASPINNARLNAISTYYNLVPNFERLIAATSPDGVDLTAFFDLVESTRSLSNDERRAFLDSGAAPR